MFKSVHREFKDFWALSAEKALELLETTENGLSKQDAHERLIIVGRNSLQEHRALGIWQILWNQIKNPLILLLVFSSVVSFFVGEWVDAVIILIIIGSGTSIGAYREKDAQEVISKLKQRLAPRVNVKRDGKLIVCPSSEIVPGDIVLLSAGNLVPADALILNSQDCFVNEAALTGESFPVLKFSTPNGIPGKLSIGERKNALFHGSHIQTGKAECLVINTGSATIFGKLIESVDQIGPETDFDRNIDSFGYLMIKMMFLIVLVVFSVSTFKSGFTIQTLMFSISLAIGLSPELLPLIINYDLAMGVRKLSLKGLLVRHPKALENIASTDILCTDKSGTITEGVVNLFGAFDQYGNHSEVVLESSYINANLQTGMLNPLDEILKKQTCRIQGDIKKIGEIPYDFKRKRLSIVTENHGKYKMITKGAFQNILDICDLYDNQKIDLYHMFEKWSNQGKRVLGVSERDLSRVGELSAIMERDMKFLGFLVFQDQIKENFIQTLNELKKLGVNLKIISGDNTLVTKAVAAKVGLNINKVMEGRELDSVSNEALPQLIEEIEIYTQVDPHQKERIILAMKKKGHTVAYMGDGINDISAMHAADVSISVDSAVDVAKSTADMVLLEKSLELIKEGISEGRVTFNNSIKYINITMSANLGNMISMAVASLYLPFLPLLAGQVLLNNLLSDIPSLGLANDNVEFSQIQKPSKWNLNLILKYMLAFGLISTFFDLLVFYFLRNIFKVSIADFRTGWFVESLLTELLVVFILRTQKPFFRSKPSKLLLRLTLLIIFVTFMIPYLPGAHLLGFSHLSEIIMFFLVGITFAYLITTEVMKRWLFRKIN